MAFGCPRFALIVCPKMQTQMQMEIKRTTAMIAMMISSMGMPATENVLTVICR
jgi:hypothetical protein